MVQGETPMDDDEGPFSELTPRETEILCLLAEGQSNKLIARNLGISDGTVKLHVKAILRKLSIHCYGIMSAPSLSNGKVIPWSKL